jgi:putative nucleotidyltransferase with HDIG domain
MRNKAVKLLEDIETNKLPSLPHILVKLLRACRDEEICFDTLSNIISQDASLTTKVIKAANSPVYGRARHLSSLKQILMFLGLDTIKSITITASIQQFFSEYNNQKTQFLKTFWLHSLTCAIISRSLAELTSYPYPEEAYLSGLLHDIGKLMIEPGMDRDYQSYNHWNYPADEISRLEKDAVDINHSELAAIMLEKWNMPDVMCNAVRYHHAGAEEIQQTHLLAKILNFSSLLACNISNQDKPVAVNAGIQLFDLSESIINDIVKQAEEETRSLAVSMDIDIGETDQANSQQKDELKQIKLAREIRDTALAQNSQTGNSTDFEGFYKSVQQSISLLFDVNKNIFLTLNKSEQVLEIEKQQHYADTSLLEELNINMNTSSAITHCLNNNKITNSFSINTDKSSFEALNITDAQLTHALKTEGFICMPVIHSYKKYGVLLLGTSHKQANKLLSNNTLLRLFSDNVSVKIKQHKDYAEKISDLTEANSELFLARAKNIIHETNNPLTVIKNYLQLLSKKLSSDDPAQSDLTTIKHEIDRISNIILHCRDMPETINMETTNVDLNVVLTEIIDLYRGSLFTTHNIISTLNLGKNLKPVEFDKNSLKQIVSNILKNSVEAMQSNGEITITTRTININGKKHIELKLQDNGPGIPAQIMDDLYKPVQSSKGLNHSGIGLSITKNLIDNNNGIINCTTSTDGTIFSLQFPEKNN